MTKLELEPWEREPLWLKALTPVLKARRFPAMPADPRPNKWYRYYPAGAISGEGAPAFADIRLGTVDKVLVFFSGGGVSVDEYSAARPASLYMRDKDDMFYMVHLDLFGDFVTRAGILDDHADNPFRDWTKVVLTYGTGDFHIGTKDFPYSALDGSDRLLHHHGFTNYRAVMAEVQRLIPSPEHVVIAGCSGGGWGAALLADDVIGHFPGGAPVTCIIDSAIGLKDDWAGVAAEVWGAPPEIVSRLRSDNMVTDSLIALHQAHGDRVDILYAGSVRDAALARMQNYLDGGKLEFTREAGEKLETDLRQMTETLMAEIPGVGFYLFDTPDRAQKGLGLMKHCVIGDQSFRGITSDGKTARDWIGAAVNGEVRSYGLGLVGAALD